MSKDRPHNKSAFFESPFGRLLCDEWVLGETAAADPLNAGLPPLVLRTTTTGSAWYTRPCKVCKDPFREGDQVRVCPVCHEPYHDDSRYGLHCWQGQFHGGGICGKGGPKRFSETGRIIEPCPFTWSDRLPDELSAAGHSDESSHLRMPPPELMVIQFVSAVERIWRPFGDQQSQKVAPKSRLVGRKCPWCRFKVRAGDWVVACPCGKNCGTYFHQDVFRHLTCWNEWNGAKGSDHCPTTGAAYRRSEGKREEPGHGG